jgi:hypothetical protein
MISIGKVYINITSLYDHIYVVNGMSSMILIDLYYSEIRDVVTENTNIIYFEHLKLPSIELLEFDVEQYTRYQYDVLNRRHGYELYQDTLTILDHAIVKTIDFQYGKIELDIEVLTLQEVIYQYNYRHQTAWLFEKDIVRKIVLPGIPKSVIHEKYKLVGSNVKNVVSHNFYSTNVTIFLTKRIHDIHTQEVYPIMRNRYTFHLITTGIRHTINLNDGYSFILQSESKKPCTWILQFLHVDFNKIHFPSYGKVQIGEVNISVETYGDHIYLSDDWGKVYFIDVFAASKTILTSIARQASAQDINKYQRESEENAVNVAEYFWNLHNIYHFHNGYSLIGESLQIHDNAIIHELD